MKKNGLANLLFLAVLFLSGCAQKDPIDRIVNQESGNSNFRSGPFHPINLPSNAPISEVITQAFENAAPSPMSVAGINIVTQRQVIIFRMPYTAVLVKTADGQRVILLQYHETMGWWSRMYN